MEGYRLRSDGGCGMRDKGVRGQRVIAQRWRDLSERENGFTAVGSSVTRDEAAECAEGEDAEDAE